MAKTSRKTSKKVMKKAATTEPETATETEAAAPAAAQGAGMTKTGFILSFPPQVPPREIMAQAKKQGIHLTANLVYAVRSSAKRKGTRPEPTASAPAPAPVAERVVNVPAGSLEAQLVDLALDLGLMKSIKLLEQLKSKARSLAVS